MNDLWEWLASQPLTPFVRSAGYAVRKVPIKPLERRLLDYFLLYMQEGNAEVILDGKIQAVKAGDFLFFQPDELKSLISTEPMICAFAHFDIFYHPQREQSFAVLDGTVDLDAYRHLMQPRLNAREGLAIPLILKLSEPARFKDSFLRMVDLWLSGSSVCRLEANHLAAELVIALLKDNSGWNSLRTRSEERLDWVPAFLMRHMNGPLSVKEMAAHAYMSESRFNVLFKHRYGLPPHQYLMNLRTEHVKELLDETDLTLMEIADLCGFADIHHLSKAFKQRIGLSPKQYRSGMAVELETH